jgi:transcriptional regulator with XRE-family HTH domain
MPAARIVTALRSIAANIRRLRLRQKLTQEQLAEAAELEPRYVQTLESGRGNPTAAVLIAVADALGVTPGVLFRPAELLDRRPGRPATHRTATAAGRARRARKSRGR